ncbi:MAG: ABC transporter substrate binding protein [Xanthobacteraceae bacterium]
MQEAARGIGQNVIVLNARAERDFDTAFATLVQQRVRALLVADDALFISRREKLVSLAALHAVPTIYGRREFVAAGGLISYGASTVDQYYQCGIYVGRIQKGAPISSRGSAALTLARLIRVSSAHASAEPYFRLDARIFGRFVAAMLLE